MIKETEDYEIFKKHNLNRSLDEANIKKIMQSLNIKNLMHKRPILVNSNMEIIDGQHRLEACRRLNLPIFYEIEKTLENSDIILLNANQKPWNKEDYVYHHANDGNLEYKNLINFAKKYDLPLATCINLLDGRRGKDGNMHLKSGEFKMPDPNSDRYIKIINSMDKYHEITQYIHAKILGNKHFLRGTKFKRILIEFICRDLVDPELLFQKIVQRLDVIAPRPSGKDYWQMWREIYNFRNQNPLP